MSLLERFFSDKKEKENNNTGTKIRRLRNQKKISASELGVIAGVNETAIRNYERGYRQVSNEKLELIAQGLGVPLETLVDRQINNYTDVIHILFELSEQYEFEPIAIPQKPQYVIQTKNETMLQAIQAWYDKRRQWETGSITQVEFKEWMDAFPLMCKAEIEEPIEIAESVYSDFERIMGFKSALESMELIVNSKVEEISACLDKKDNRTARMHLEILKSTVSTLVQVDIKKYGK